MTPDEIEFLRRTGALDKMEGSPSNETQHNGKKRPEIPRKTMIAIAIVFILLTIAFVSSVQSIQPYASLAENKSLMSYLSMTGGSGSTNSGADMASKALAASNVYGARGIIISSLVSVGVIVEGVLIGQWWFRLRRWENNHEE